MLYNPFANTLDEDNRSIDRSSILISNGWIFDRETADNTKQKKHGLDLSGDGYQGQEFSLCHSVTQKILGLLLQSQDDLSPILKSLATNLTNQYRDE
jgi:hypothetical protein